MSAPWRAAGRDRAAVSSDFRRARLQHGPRMGLGGWCSTGVYGGGRDPLGGRERFNGWSPLSILLLAVGFEGCREPLVAVGGCLGPCRRSLGFPRWVNSG